MGWYDTWPPAFLSSYLYAWAPLGRFVSWFYPVSWPAVGLISLSKRSSALGALAAELRPSAIFMLFAVLNAVFWLVVIVAWAGARKFRLRQSRAGA